MSTKANKYIIESLAATGFAIIDSTIACTLRPDLWTHGMEAAGDFSPRFFRPIQPLGAREFTVLLEGRDKRLTMLARSDMDLAYRVEAVTGIRVLGLFEKKGALDPSALAKPALPTRDEDLPNGDRFKGVTTAEPGRKCHECAQRSVAGKCLNVAASGIEWPVLRVSRRCLGFKPHYESLDSRTGPQLWPELVALASA